MISNVDYTGIALVITALGTIISPIVTVLFQRKTARQLDTNTAQLAEGQAGIHTLVDGAKSLLEAQNLALKVEVARVAREGEAPTPEQVPGVAGNAPVGISAGVVTAEDQRTDRRIDDVKSGE